MRFPRSECGPRRPVAPPGNGFRPFGEHDLARPLAALLEDALRRHAGRTAVVGSERLTYAALDRRSAAVSAALARRLEPGGASVALLARPDVDVVLAEVAAVRAGVPFVPLDPREADGPLAATLARARPDLLVVEGDLVERARALAGEGIAVAPVEALEAEGAGRPAPPAPEPDGCACVFFTSGSSGEPVGVAMDQRFLAFDAARQTNDLELGPEDRLDLVFSPAFSAALAPTFGALVSGASLRLVDLKALGVHALPAWLARERISVSNQSTSTMRALLELPELRDASGDALPDLRLLCVGGEALRAEDARRFQARVHAGCLLQNALASTETRTLAQLFLGRGDAVEDPVPAGHPVLGRTVTLVGDDGRPVPLGEEGDVVVSGASLTTRYHGDTRGRDAERYRRDPDGITHLSTGDRGRFDAVGRLVHLGRSDRIVKTRGYRVDLAEVEEALRALGLADEALAVGFEEPGGETAVGAALQSRHVLELAELRARLGERLPSHALPARLYVAPALPRNANDKLDRRAIRARLEERAAAVDFGGTNPGASLVDALTVLWREALAEHAAPETVDQAADFFRLGGDSLSAAGLLAELEARRGVRVRFQELVDRPTPRALAEALERGDRRERYAVELAAGAGGAVPLACLLPAITGQTEALEDLPRHSTSGAAFHLLTAVSPRDAAPEEFSIPWVASVYRDELLRAGAQRPLVLVGFSWGAYVAHELACQLAETGRAVRALVLLDARVPRRTLPRPPGRAERLALQLANLPAWLRHDLLTSGAASLRLRLGGLARELRPRRRTADSGPDLGAYFGRAGFHPAFEEDFRARYAAALAFRPRTWRGATLVLRASAQSMRDPRAGALGWEHFVEPAPAVHAVPGHHESMLRPPHVARLVRHLDALLR